MQRTLLDCSSTETTVGLELVETGRSLGPEEEKKKANPVIVSH